MTDIDMNPDTNGQLKQIVDRIETLEEQKADVASDIKEVYLEAKGSGFDCKILRKVIAIRKKDRQARLEEAELISLYEAALGMD